MVVKVFNPKITKELADMGERIKLARLRRGQSMTLVSARAGMTRVTLTAIEKGDPGVSLGAYLSVLKALRLAEDINLIAKDDVLGKQLQDLNLDPVNRSRAPKRASK